MMPDPGTELRFGPDGVAYPGTEGVAYPTTNTEPTTPVPEEQYIDAPVSNSALGTMLAAPGYVVGEITSSDYLIPTLKLVHSVGPSSQDFEPGTLLLNYTVPLSAGQPDGSGTTINLTVFKIRKFYLENLPYPAPEGQMPRVFDTQAEMQAAGGHTVWQNNQKPPFSEAAEALIIIECPDCGDSAIQAELEDHFPYQTPSGKLVTAALWRLTGGSYRLAAKPIFSCADMAMRVQGLPFAKWKLGTRRVQVEKNVVWQFVLTRNGVNEAKDVEFFKEMLGA
jgi:hypothetical protein